MKSSLWSCTKGEEERSKGGGDDGCGERGTHISFLIRGPPSVGIDTGGVAESSRRGGRRPLPPPFVVRWGVHYVQRQILHKRRFCSSLPSDPSGVSLSRIVLAQQMSVDIRKNSSCIDRKLFILMAKTSLPPGFRFHPTDVELVSFYLRRKVMGKPFRFEAIAEVELYKFAPWDLREKSQLRSKDLEWYFFCPRDKKYPNGSRSNRATDIGYWKATGKDRPIIHNTSTVGMKKTLIFHEGKPPKGNRTDWVMYEYRLENREMADARLVQDTYVLCKIFQKSGAGPKIGEQYGAPFNEEDWEDDASAENPFPLPCVSCSSLVPLDNQTIQLEPVNQQPAASSHIEVSSDPDLLVADGIFQEELAEFFNSSLLVENTNAMMPDSAILDMNVNETSALDAEGMYNELEINLSSQEIISGSANHPENISRQTALYPMLSELDSEQYVELNDFCFIGNSNLPEPIMPNDPFAWNPSAHFPNFQDQTHIPDPISYLNNEAIADPLQAGPCITGEQPSLNKQIEDCWEIISHLNAPVSEHEHCNPLQEFLHPAYLTATQGFGRSSLCDLLTVIDRSVARCICFVYRASALAILRPWY
ncbi:hypothetical protein OPV22_000493 [Ensete ventricosum]|uniref:NAC domain-containing protein n=1 Tax=Ensete ventricosum TaxID=4639 RepID=A0AAV8RUD4_ENSVE|nr:hypothetical protein OPV22_000493 [Ensete ventricosum]